LFPVTFGGRYRKEGNIPSTTAFFQNNFLTNLFFYNNNNNIFFKKKSIIITAVNSWIRYFTYPLQSYQFTAIHIYNKEIHSAVYGWYWFSLI